jgi:hypothetical protein
MRSDDCESVIIERKGETHGRSVDRPVGTIACTLPTTSIHVFGVPIIWHSKWGRDGKESLGTDHPAGNRKRSRSRNYLLIVRRRKETVKTNN